MEWLLTYAVHSTALIALVWLLTTIIPKISLGTKEALWKVALLGPLMTATVHQVAGVPSVFGSLPVPSALRTAVAESTPPQPSAPVVLASNGGAVQIATTAADGGPSVERRVVRHRAGDLEITTIRQRQAPTMAAAPAVAAPTEPSPWPMVLLGLWGVGAVLGLARLGWSARRLSKQLAGRRDVIEDPVLEGYLDLCSKAGLKKRPRLTASAHLRSPIALGRREICVPERAVDSLSAPQQQGMLAHELAHLVRHDPVWNVATAVFEAVFFFQPLNYLARRKIQEVAEFQCDDWAARQTGTGVHLAKCLAEVAGWVEDGPPMTAAATSMAGSGSPIVRRITRLLHERRRGGRVHPVGRVALTIGTLGAVIALVPGVSQAEHDGAAPPPRRITVASLDGSPRGVVFEDRSDAAHDRSVIRVMAGDEMVEINVQAPNEVPLPPPAPEPPRGDRMEIRIHGHVGPWGPWGFDDSWLGMLGLGSGGFEIHLRDDDDSISFFGHGGHEHHRARAQARAKERARARLERHRERLERHAERLERRAERIERDLEEAVREAVTGASWSGEPTRIEVVEL
ncbi:MAG: M56 family metallopeptidase [Myxococcota bacterium]